VILPFPLSNSGTNLTNSGNPEYAHWAFHVLQNEQSLCCFAVAGTELTEIQKQIDNLPVKTDPQSVGQLLALRRDVLFLEFDVAVRHSVRDTFLATGNVPAYKVCFIVSLALIFAAVQFCCDA